MRRAFELLARYPGQLAVVIVLTLLAGLFEGLGLLLLVPLLAIVGIDVPVDGPVGSIASAVVGSFGAWSLPITLEAVLGVYVAVVAGQSGLRYLEQVRATAIVETIKADLRGDVFAAIARASWGYHLRRRGSDLLQVLSEEVSRAGDVAKYGLSIATMALTAVVYLSVALYLSPFASGVAILTATGLLLVIRNRSARSRRAGEAWSEASEGVYFTATEFMSGLKTAKSHATEGRHIEAFERETRRLAGAWVDSARSYADVQFIFTVGAAAVLSLLVWAALDAFQLEPAALLVLIYIFVRLIPRFSSLQRSLQHLVNALPGLARVDRVVAEARANAESQGATVAGVQDCYAKRVPLISGIRLETVCYRYGPDSAAGSAEADPASLALYDVTLEIPVGRTTALVGGSGGGKTTLADLLIGLLRPEQGRVLVDGVPLDEVDLVAWRRGLGYVAQETVLFNDTIRANLLPDAGASDATLMEALASASLDQFVQRLPLGLDTMVGERGVRLSGGERQRLALARALVRGPTLLILDEATSALDYENEALIRDALGRLHDEMTILLITHRLGLARHADRIHVIDGGRIVQSGTWAELSLTVGRFRDLATAAGHLG